MKNLIKITITILVCVCSFTISHAQTTGTDKKATKAADVKRIITAQNYVFIANNAIPYSGGSRMLSSGYDVNVSKDTLAIFLPYFGRSFVGPMDPTQGGVKLTTTKFDHNAVANKKGSWSIIIKPDQTNASGVKDVQQLQLNVTPDGYATLRVTSLNRQPISFNGFIEERKK